MAVFVAPYTEAPYLMPGPAPVLTRWLAAFLPSCRYLSFLLQTLLILLRCTERRTFFPAEKSTPSSLACLTVLMPIPLSFLASLPLLILHECRAAVLSPASPLETNSCSSCSSSLMQRSVAL